MRKEEVGCVQTVKEKKKFIVQFEYGHNKEMSSFSLVYACSKQEVCIDMDEPISDLPPKKQGEQFNTYGDSNVEAPCMFDRGVYFSFFCVKNI